MLGVLDLSAMAKWEEIVIRFFRWIFAYFSVLKLMGIVGYDLNIRRCVSGHFYFWVRPIITAGPLWFQISAVHIGLISHR